MAVSHFNCVAMVLMWHGWSGFVAYFMICLQIKKLSDEFQEEMKKISETQEHLLSVFKHYHKVSSDCSSSFSFWCFLFRSTHFCLYSCEVEIKFLKVLPDFCCVCCAIWIGEVLEYLTSD